MPYTSGAGRAGTYDTTFGCLKKCMKKCAARRLEISGSIGSGKRQRKMIRTVGEVVRTPTTVSGAGARRGGIRGVKEGRYCAWEEAGDCLRL